MVKVDRFKLEVGRLEIVPSLGRPSRVQLPTYARFSSAVW